MVSLGVAVVVVYHMVELHGEGRSNPLGVGREADKVRFHEVFSYKDVVGLVGLLGAYWLLVICVPYMAMDRARFEEVSYVKTPVHIKPEWYFLFVYCVLRSVASKLGGVVLMLMAVLGLVFLTAAGGVRR